MPHFQKRHYKPHRPEKYVGDPTRIIMRSSWETRFALWCERTKAVVEWSSEETIIPYVSPVDNKTHRYFVDFKVKINNGKSIQTYLVEIKPYAQTQRPVAKQGKRKARLLEEAATYAINQAKWRAASAWAEDRGWQFKVLTEYELGIVKP